MHLPGRSHHEPVTIAPHMNMKQLSLVTFVTVTHVTVTLVTATLIP